MKKFKKVYDQIRNYLHVVGFFTLAYWLIGFTDIDWPTWQKIVFAGPIGLVIGGVLAAVYEFLKKVIFLEPIDDWDIYRSAFGFMLGMYLVMFKPNIEFVNLYMFWFCLVLLVADVIRAVIQKFSKNEP